MFRILLAFVLAIILASSFILGESHETLILTKTHLGPLELNEDLMISKALLEKKFPGYLVTQEYMQGDSPDFYYFKIATKDGELLFTIQSYLKDVNNEQKNAKASTELHIDLLEVQSPRIVDSYGIRPGDKVSDIVKLREKDLDFGLSHFDVYMGKGKIFYNIDLPSNVLKTSDLFQKKNSPEIKKKAIQENWTIISISWPGPAWW